MNASSKPRMLTIAPRPPWPLTDGGAIRAFHIFRQMATDFDLDLATLLRPQDDDADVRGLASHGARIHTLRSKASHTRDALNLIPGLVAGTPITYARYNQPAFRRLLAGLARENRYDFVLFDRMHTTHYRDLFDGVPHGVDTQNNDITMYERWAENRPDPASKAFGRIQANLCRRYLQRVLPQMDLVFAVSDKERQQLQAIAPASTVLEASNGVDIEKFRPGTAERKSNVLLFLGNMGWLPNADGCEFLLRDIMPIIREKRPDIHLILAGHEPRPNVRALAGEGVEVTGFVPDVLPYLHESTVFIVPLRIGAGTRLKILEAMGTRIPIVSTSVGAEGIAGQDGRHFLIRDDPRAFAEAVLDLLDNAPLRESLADNALQLVVSTYEWSIITRRMTDAIRQQIAARR